MTEGRDLAKSFGCRYIEASAKQRVNVDESFYSLVREIRRYNKEQSGASTFFVCMQLMIATSNGNARQQMNVDDENKGSGCCCVIQ